MVCFVTRHNIGHAAVVRGGKLYDWGDTRMSHWTQDNELEIDKWKLVDHFYQNGFKRMVLERLKKSKRMIVKRNGWFAGRGSRGLSMYGQRNKKRFMV